MRVVKATPATGAVGAAVKCLSTAAGVLCYSAGGSEGFPGVRRTWLKFRTVIPVALMALALAGCSGFGSPKKDVAPSDPNAYPANYRKQIADFLRQSLMTRTDFRGAFISQPVLMPIGDSQRYMVCVQFRGNSQAKTKVAVYFAGMISQFVDATPEQCGSVAYTPFTELAAALPPG
jgi:hypothetical protein